MDRSDRKRRCRSIPAPGLAACNVLAFAASRGPASLGEYEIVQAGNVSVLRLTGARGMVQLSLTREAWLDFSAQLISAAPKAAAGEP